MLGESVEAEEGGGLQNQRCHRKRGRGERAWRRGGVSEIKDVSSSN